MAAWIERKRCADPEDFAYVGWAILFEAEQEETQANPDKEIDLETLIIPRLIEESG